MQNQPGFDSIPGFTSADALAAFSPDMLSESSVNEWVLYRLHPAGARCPHCKVVIEDERRYLTFWSGGRVCCKACKKWFTSTTNTILHGSQLSFRQVFLIAVFTEFAGMTDAHPTRSREYIARILNIHPDTVASWQTNLKALEVAGV